jgi:hypothetical protein
METTVRDSATLRRCLAIGTAAILGAAALLPSSVSAHHAAHPAIISTEAHTAHPAAIEVKDADTERGEGGTGCLSSEHSASSEDGKARGVVRCEPSRSLKSETSGMAALPLAVGAANPSTTTDHETNRPDLSATARGARLAGSTVSTVAAPSAPVGVAGPASNSSTSSGAGRSATTPQGVPPGSRGTLGSSGITHQAPVPVPSQPTVLGPVPLVVPALGGVVAPAGGALPWAWFAGLAAVDLGLMAGILVRRRRRRGAG